MEAHLPGIKPAAPPATVAGERGAGGHASAAPRPRAAPLARSVHYRLAGRAARSEDTLVRVGNLLIGGNGFVVMAGPGSVESEEQIQATARFVRDRGAHVLRGGVFRPRSGPDAFQGLGMPGLELLAAAGRAVGMPVVTEVHVAGGRPAGGRARRHPADRRPQHAELSPAARGGQGQPTRSAQARAVAPPSTNGWPPPNTSWRRATVR